MNAQTLNCLNDIRFENLTTEWRSAPKEWNQIDSNQTLSKLFIDFEITLR